MSIKIWTAYRLKKTKLLWDLVHDTRITATQNVIEALKTSYREHLPHVRVDTSLYRTRLEKKSKIFDPSKAEQATRLSIVGDLFRRAYRFNSTKPYRSVYNFDVSVGFRQYEGGIYVIPYCDCLMRNVLDFLKQDARLEDFHYQNQTDRPKFISPQKWGNRKRVYTAMEWDDVLVLDICRWDMFYKLDPSCEMMIETLGGY